jgi:hypothetical protein
MDKLIQLIGIVLLYLVGLSDPVNITGTKCAWLSIRKTTILQINRLTQAGKNKQGITSLNSHFLFWGFGTKCWGRNFLIWVKHICQDVKS